MTQVSEIIALVRDMLQDSASPGGDRYKDDRLIRALNLGLRDIRRMRPDMFIGRYSTPVWQATAADELFDAPDICIAPLVKYIGGWVEMGDDEFADDGRAMALMAMYKRDLGIPA